MSDQVTERQGRAEKTRRNRILTDFDGKGTDTQHDCDDSLVPVFWSSPTGRLLWRILIVNWRKIDPQSEYSLPRSLRKRSLLVAESRNWCQMLFLISRQSNCLLSPVFRRCHTNRFKKYSITYRCVLVSTFVPKLCNGIPPNTTALRNALELDIVLLKIS